MQRFWFFKSIVKINSDCLNFKVKLVEQKEIEGKDDGSHVNFPNYEAQWSRIPIDNSM